MTKTWPESVTRLIEAFGTIGAKLDQPTTLTSISEKLTTLPALLVMEAPATKTWNDQEVFAGHESMIDFLTNAEPLHDLVSTRAMCLVTIGDSQRPHLVSFGIVPHYFDIQATAETLLAYYEAKEQLPYGFTDAVSSWLMYETCRMGYGDENMERYRDRKGQEAVKLFRDAICDVSDITETPALLQILDDKSLAYSSRRAYIAGKATRQYCRMMCQPDGPHFNEAMANIFECKAREVLTWFFVSNVAYKYGINSENTTYRNLPRSQMIGALAHLPLPYALPEHTEAC